MDEIRTGPPSRLPVAYRHPVTGAALAAAAAWTAYSMFFVPHNLPLPPAVESPRRETVRRAGRLSYYADDAAPGADRLPPLLLIHSINAAASAYEVRPLFEWARRSRAVYAVDLPGYGFSDRSDRRYDPRLFTDAVLDMLDEIGERHDGKIDALAVSLGCEFLARAAVERPGSLRSLAFVTPTGFSRGAEAWQGPPGATREVPGLYPLFRFPLWRQPFYDLLVSRTSIRYFLQRTFGRKEVDEDMVAYDYLTAHQPGAANAPYAFVSGRLFSRDVYSLYQRLTLPVWMPHATRGDFKDFSGAGWTRSRPNWHVLPLPTGALPHVERPAEFCEAYEAFLSQQVSATSRQSV